MLRSKQNPRKPARRQLELERLEDRQVLTAILGGGYTSDVSYHQVAQNDDIEELPIGGFYLSVDLTAVGPAEHGTVSLDDGIVTYTPAADFVGLDTFEYTYVSEAGDSLQGTGYVNVTESVYALPDWIQVAPGSVDVALEIVGNDYSFQSGYWNDANQITLTEVGPAAHGTVTLADDGLRAIYTPSDGFIGVDEFSYTIRDSFGNESTATAKVDVTNKTGTGAFSNEEHFFIDQLSKQVETQASLFGSSSTHFGWDHLLIMEDGMLFTPIVANGVGAQFNALAGSDRFAQVEGVGEGDILIQAGDRLFVAAGNEVRIVDISDPSSPQLLDTIAFDEPIAELYSHEGRLTVITEEAENQWQIGERHHSPAFEYSVHVLDVSDAAQTEFLFSTQLDGDYRDSRFIDGTLYTIANHGELQVLDGLQVDEATDGQFYESVGDYVQRVRTEPITFFSYETTGGQGTQAGPLFGLSDFAAMSSYEQYTSIITLDTTSNLGAPIDADLTTGAHGDLIVYASTEALYLMAQEWNVGSDGLTTEIQKFAFEAESDGIDLTATGSVVGELSDQFSVDEQNGYFRIATTLNGWDIGRDGSEVSLFVMAQEGDTLKVIGSVEDIAPGERIYSTRFDGDRAFITTFRQVDPLFVIDLSDPVVPTLEGELKIPSYSNYMQVIDENYVLGIGRDASNGMFEGLQISLFDVSDASAPKLVAAYEFAGGRSTWSSVADAWNLLDYQAVTFVAESGILAIPTHTSHGWGGGSETGTNEAISVLKIDIENETIELIGDMEFDERARRSIHIDGFLYGVSDGEIQVSELMTPDQTIATLDLVGGTATKVAELESALVATDVNGDGVTSAVDAITISNMFEQHGFGEMTEAMDPNCDVNGDGQFSPLDFLAVVNALNGNNEPLESIAFREESRLVESPTPQPQIGSNETTEPDATRPVTSTETTSEDTPTLAINLAERNRAAGAATSAVPIAKLKDPEMVVNELGPESVPTIADTNHELARPVLRTPFAATSIDHEEHWTLVDSFFDELGKTELARSV